MEYIACKRFPGYVNNTHTDSLTVQFDVQNDDEDKGATVLSLTCNVKGFNVVGKYTPESTSLWLKLA